MTVAEGRGLTLAAATGSGDVKMRGEKTNPSAARTKIGAVIAVAGARAVAGSEIGIGAGEAAAAAAAIATNVTGVLSGTWRPCLFSCFD